MGQNEKKRHHYVPVSYLSAFTDEKGRVFAYRKEDPAKPLYVRPTEIAFQRYYYSQPIPGGGQDNNRLEDLFSTIESRWPRLVEKCARRESLSEEDLMLLFEFLGLMRVRVPAARDMVEAVLAAQVKEVGKILEAKGELPKPPPGLEEYLKFENLEVSIDPHRSIHAMADLAKGFARVADVIGLEVIHLPPGETFITSDNPVIYFDPEVREDCLLPYTLRPHGGAIELLFPISPTMLIRGHTSTKLQFARFGISHQDISSREAIKRMNRLIARFGYGLLIAKSSDHAPLASKYAALSPVVQTHAIRRSGGVAVAYQNVFGARRRKPKWVPRDDPANTMD